MKSFEGARVLSGTVLELAEFAHANGYKLQSSRRGYITLIPLANPQNNISQFRDEIQMHQHNRHH
ncbi:MAG TPA: hypothetical protein ENJ32_08510 [Crenotrichaceae bacterium]|nr:hypothetical protein [Crenotrichaceae bacterium]